MTIEQRLSAMGLALPNPPVPVGNYIPAAQTGNLVFTSGQTARLNGVRRHVGVVREPLGRVLERPRVERLRAVHVLGAERLREANGRASHRVEP